MISDYFKLAFGNLKHRGLRSWLTILGVVIGIAAVVALISLGNALETAVLGQFGSLSVDTLTIQNKGTGFGPPGSTVVEKLNSHDVTVIESVNGVDKVITRLLRVGSLEYNEISGFGYAVDIPKENDALNLIYTSFNLHAEQGRLLRADDKGKIMLGNDFLTTDEFGKDFVVGKKVKLKGEVEKEYEIVGILEKGNSFQANSVVFMTNEDMEELFNVNDEIDLIVVKVEDKDKIEDVALEIQRKLRNDRNEKLGEESFSVQTPLQALGAVNTVLSIINLIVIGMAAISLLVGGIGIANVMYTSVLERRKEIGVMKSIGAKNKDVLAIFIIESGLLGLVGGIMGAFLGLVIAIGASGAASSALGIDFNVMISWPLILGAIAFSFFIGVVSGVLPAMQASKLKVVEAIRG
ncbi:hypothetical protein COU57_02410 [Candidatus Pacearchaeota archaeon CG10_big_fil_rev_8_21_14_0_10_32_14]|nr:MAG: hypothetical protein COU57_02410 [Candidatus Pacearchaeota archaeon CG10_big_fil_rev_8_21_14_0_10_32_14]